VCTKKEARLQCARLQCVQGEPVACRVAPLPDGTVRAFFRAQKAGHYALAATLAAAKGGKGASLAVMVSVAPGPMDIASSRIERGDPQVRRFPGRRPASVQQPGPRAAGLHADARARARVPPCGLARSNS
jgi:hypothetical protein